MRGCYEEPVKLKTNIDRYLGKKEKIKSSVSEYLHRVSKINVEQQSYKKELQRDGELSWTYKCWLIVTM